ncbi:hypothetical protein SNEBB_007800 [Seison nebaliae]|nr:hypothetical protein SNEBB_007800 [Seison nebaliae]
MFHSTSKEFPQNYKVVFENNYHVEKEKKIFVHFTLLNTKRICGGNSCCTQLVSTLFSYLLSSSSALSGNNFRMEISNEKQLHALLPSSDTLKMETTKEMNDELITNNNNLHIYPNVDVSEYSPKFGAAAKFEDDSSEEDTDGSHSNLSRNLQHTTNNFNNDVNKFGSSETLSSTTTQNIGTIPENQLELKRQTKIISVDSQQNSNNNSKIESPKDEVKSGRRNKSKKPERSQSQKPQTGGLAHFMLPTCNTIIRSIKTRHSSNVQHKTNCPYQRHKRSSGNFSRQYQPIGDELLDENSRRMVQILESDSSNRYESSSKNGSVSHYPLNSTNSPLIGCHRMTKFFPKVDENGHAFSTHIGNKSKKDVEEFLNRMSQPKYKNDKCQLKNKNNRITASICLPSTKCCGRSKILSYTRPTTSSSNKSVRSKISEELKRKSQRLNVTTKSKVLTDVETSRNSSRTSTLSSRRVKEFDAQEYKRKMEEGRQLHLRRTTEELKKKEEDERLKQKLEEERKFEEVKLLREKEEEKRIETERKMEEQKRLLEEEEEKLREEHEEKRRKNEKLSEETNRTLEHVRTLLTNSKSPNDSYNGNNSINDGANNKIVSSILSKHGITLPITSPSKENTILISSSVTNVEAEKKLIESNESSSTSSTTPSSSEGEEEEEEEEDSLPSEQGRETMKNFEDEKNHQESMELNPSVIQLEYST